MPKHVTIAGLEQRREARLRERHHEKAAKFREGALAPGSKREIRAARLFFATLPPEDLRAAYRAVKKSLEQRKNQTP